MAKPERTRIGNADVDPDLRRTGRHLLAAWKGAVMNTDVTSIVHAIQPRSCASLSPLKMLATSVWAVHTSSVGPRRWTLRPTTPHALVYPPFLPVRTGSIGKVARRPPVAALPASAAMPTAIERYTVPLAASSHAASHLAPLGAGAAAHVLVGDGAATRLPNEAYRRGNIGDV